MIRVLIVATNIEIREGLSMVLRLAGEIEVTGAVASLGQVNQEVCSESPDIALIDLEMPEGEGYKTIQKLHQLYPCTKSIALTAHDYPAARERAIQVGACSVMVKGLDVPEMVAVIQAAAGVSIAIPDEAKKDSLQG